jgi:hypothetical protein
MQKHAARFGSEAQVASSLPVTIRGRFAQGSTNGPEEIVLDKSTHRDAITIAGLEIGEGVDASGVWTMGIAGVLERTGPTESVSPLLGSFIWRRSYVSSFDASRDHASCEVKDGVARVRIAFERPSLGDPSLELDVGTGALLTLTHRASDGKVLTTKFEEWHPPDEHGVRWPASFIEKGSVEQPAVHAFEKPAAGLVCARGSKCTDPIPQKTTFAWPPSGVVRVLMKTSHDELLVKVRANGRDVWALVDSGAGVTTVDSTTKSAESFKAGTVIEGAGATQKLRLGLGTLSSLSIGELTMRDVPTASVPVIALDAFGDDRPEIILGFTLFEAATVHVDYAKGELVLSSKSRSDGPANAAGLAKGGALPLDITVLDGKIVASATIDGVAAPMEIDTGSDGSFDLVKSWAEPHGFPGARKTATITGLFGAGTDATEVVRFRYQTATIGPIAIKDAVGTIADPPGGGTIAGLVGNDALARCAAVTFDVRGRNIWLQPPCDRARQRSRAGWALGFQSKPPKDAKSKWFISGVLPGGSAANAGIAKGDRVVSVGGKTLAGDPTIINPIVSAPAGTKVPVVVQRDGKDLKIEMLLVDVP